MPIELMSHGERNRVFFWNNVVIFHEPQDTANRMCPEQDGGALSLVWGRTLPNWEFSNTPGRAVPCADHGSDEQPDAMIF